MLEAMSRRSLLRIAAVGFQVSAMNVWAGWPGSDAGVPDHDRVLVRDTFPAHPPELVREVVTVAHFDLGSVKELLSTRPSLARAGWDWGFGDWETPLGAASHMGNRPIAEYLMSQGAPPSLFSAAMLGQLEIVKALVKADPVIQRLSGPHSISLLAHARMGGAAGRTVFDFLQTMEGADAEPPVSLTEEQTSALVGTYVFGVGVDQQVELTSDMAMYANNKMYTYAPQLNWTRKGTMTRPLFHLGSRIFYPAGAPSVRIRFIEDGDGVVMKVRDGELEVSALRKRQPKG